MSVVRLPTGRGPMSARVLDILTGSDGPSSDAAPDSASDLPSDVSLDGHSDDVQLALYLCYEVQYAGLPGTEHLEWDVGLIEIRQTLERAFRAALDEDIARFPVGRRSAPTSPTGVSTRSTTSSTPTTARRCHARWRPPARWSRCATWSCTGRRTS